MYFDIREMHGFARQFPKACEIVGNLIEWEKPKKMVSGKILQNWSYLENLENWYSYFTHSMGAFFPLDLHSVVYFIICEMHGFPHQFPVAWKNAVKSIKLGETRKLVPIFSLSMNTFLPSDYHLMVYFPIWEMHGFFHQFLIARENAAKSIMSAFWLIFHSIIVSTYSKIYLFLKRKNRKNR